MIRCQQLQEEARSLREELRSCEARLQVATAEEAALRADGQDRREQQKRRLVTQKAEAARHRSERSRSERSLQQAQLEEQRVTELLRALPTRTEETIGRLKASCDILRQGNQRLEEEIESIQQEFSTARDVVSCDVRRAGPSQKATRCSSMRSLMEDCAGNKTLPRQGMTASRVWEFGPTDERITW